MMAMFFGQYLLSKGVIDSHALIDAIEWQRRSNLSLPELAVRRGCIEPEQAAEILIKYRTSDATLEELCLEYGVGPELLEELTSIRRSGWVRIGAALVAGGHLSSDEVSNYLAEFQKLEQKAHQRLETDFQTCRESETVKTCVELALFHLSRLADRPVKIRSLVEDDGELAKGRRRYAQKLIGDRELCIALDLPSDLSSIMAAEMVGMQFEEGSEAAIDAMCECVNVIGGNACTRLEAHGVRLRPEPPFSVGDDEPSAPEGPAIRAEVVAGDAEFHVVVFV